MDGEFQRLYREYLKKEQNVRFELEKHIKQKLLIVRMRYGGDQAVYNYVYLDWPYE